AKAPTCTQSGWNEYEACANCGYSTYTEIAATGHSFGNWIAEIPATCESQGTLGHYNCSLCNKNFDEQKNELNSLIIAALKHNESDWIVQKQATCTAEGSKYKECTVCKKVLASQTIEKLEHNLVGYEAKAPTCTQSGWNEYEACANCSYSTYTEIAATGHDYEKVVTAPTCTQSGYTTYTCHCGNTYVDDYVSVTGHDYEKVVTAPTCTQSGYTTYTCHCGNTYVDDYVNATGHDYEKVVTAPTCTKGGYTTYVCSCGSTYVDDEVEPTGHSFGDWQETKAPTQTENGEKQRSCHCGKTEYEVIPAIGSNDNNSTAPDSSVNNDEGDKKTGCKSLISGEAANLLFLLCSSVIVFIKKKSYSL
ncbi:MAG: hypothetical protein IJW13_06140, partial [Clostridia bacterium]|nr:hypothetical protein [Clostridia bacterium]